MVEHRVPGNYLLKKCAICSLLVFNVERHIIFQHSATETVVEDDSATEIDEEIIELEETSFPEKAPEISTHGSLVEGQIVLVQRKSVSGSRHGKRPRKSLRPRMTW